MIKLTDLLEAEKAFTATSKETGNVSVFKTKAARDAAVKAGSHEKRKTDKDDAVDVPTGEKKPNMFSKDAGYDAPDTDKSEPKKDEPVKDSSGGRAGNPQVNKATRQKAKELGITPENLGREEYELKMVQAAHEALTDSNFHSEARKLIAIMEDNPELEKNPAMDPNKPGLGEPGYDDWVKTTAWGSKYGDSSDETDELGRAASNEAGWDGKDALDGIAFELKMRGFKDLAAKIAASPFEKTDNGFILANTEMWSDADAVSAFRSALRSGVMNRIIMGTASDKPYVMSGKTYMPKHLADMMGLPESKRIQGYAEIESPFLALPFTFYTYTFGAFNKITTNYAQGTVRNPAIHFLVAMFLGYQVMKMKKAFF